MSVSMPRLAAVSLSSLLGLVSPAWAQPAPAPPQPATAPTLPGRGGGAVRNVEVDPIRCWWRSTTGAIRIGETFSVGLTCAVLENDAVQVVPDESRLGVAVIQMSPFEVVGGAHPADLHTAQRRFFQYEYTLRLINPDVIGRDVVLPSQLLHYRINSRVSPNQAQEGRDHTYSLPPEAVRVVAMVPADATDIRDASGEPFDIIETLGFRASALNVASIIFIALGSLMIVLSLVRVVTRARRLTPVGERILSEGAVAGHAARELAAVQRDAEGQGWSDALVGRALAASRLAAAGAIGRPVSQRPVGSEEDSGEGRIVVARDWRGRRHMALSSAVTTDDVARAIARTGIADHRRDLIEDARTALATFGGLLYRREGALDTSALDDALARASSVARRIKAEQRWPAKYLRRWPARLPAAERQT